MFDLITNGIERPLRERSPRSKLASLMMHVVVMAAVIALPLLGASTALPDGPKMMAFVAEPPSPPSPPPPPPPPPGRGMAARRIPPPTPKHPETAAPIEVPLRPDAVATTGTASSGGAVGKGEGGVEGGVPGGVVGGVVGGVLGGVLGGVSGGFVSSIEPLPPPPPPKPVRVGGQITAPALVHRVEPTYPDIARAAEITGVVIVEAVVDTEGCVESVKVLRSRNTLLDQAAIDALRQWRYSPLVLNGIPTSFVLTVTFNFSVRR
jgi:protein TonB